MIAGLAEVARPKELNAGSDACLRVRLGIKDGLFPMSSRFNTGGRAQIPFDLGLLLQYQVLQVQ